MVHMRSEGPVPLDALILLIRDGVLRDGSLVRREKALETVGIWLPVLLVSWGAIRTRITAAAYVVAAGTLGALAYYQPFDVVIVNGEVLGPRHPQYVLALMFSLVIAAVPFAGGIAVRRRRETRAA
jgi:hypothetical protein